MQPVINSASYSSTYPTNYQSTQGYRHNVSPNRRNALPSRQHQRSSFPPRLPLPRPPIIKFPFHKTTTSKTTYNRTFFFHQTSPPKIILKPTLKVSLTPPGKTTNDIATFLETFPGFFITIGNMPSQYKIRTDLNVQSMQHVNHKVPIEL